ncbi:MAG: hypothetical protein ABH829_00975 [archaeon]
MIQQALFVLCVIAAGIPLSYWVRRVDMGGLELWLPMGILVSIGISPLAGIAVALTIMVVSWFLFPFNLMGLIIMGVCMVVFCYLTGLFTFTEASIVKNVLLLVVAYNIVSNVVLYPIWPNPMSILKFFAFSTWLSWLITSQFGWKIVTWLAM